MTSRPGVARLGAAKARPIAVASATACTRTAAVIAVPTAMAPATAGRAARVDAAASGRTAHAAVAARSSARAPRWSWERLPELTGRLNWAVAPGRGRPSTTTLGRAGRTA